MIRLCCLIRIDLVTGSRRGAPFSGAQQERGAASLVPLVAPVPLRSLGPFVPRSVLRSSLYNTRSAVPFHSPPSAFHLTFPPAIAARSSLSSVYSSPHQALFCPPPLIFPSLPLPRHTWRYLLLPSPPQHLTSGHLCPSSITNATRRALLSKRRQVAPCQRAAAVKPTQQVSIRPALNSARSNSRSDSFLSTAGSGSRPGSNGPVVRHLFHQDPHRLLAFCDTSCERLNPTRKATRSLGPKTRPTRRAAEDKPMQQVSERLALNGARFHSNPKTLFPGGGSNGSRDSDRPFFCFFVLQFSSLCLAVMSPSPFPTPDALSTASQRQSLHSNFQFVWCSLPPFKFQSPSVLSHCLEATEAVPASFPSSAFSLPFPSGSPLLFSINVVEPELQS